jgi:hypothetical protein
MTQIGKKAIERMPALRAWQASRHQAGPFQVPEYEDFAAIVQEHEALAAALDAAEARERAAVAAAYEKAAKELEGCNLGLDPADMADDIRALSDTDALAEWKAEAKRNIRDSVLHECLDIAESLGRQFAEATYASDEGRLQNAAKCYAAGEIATAIEERIAAAIRQETNDE